ncbi:transcription termination factor NusA [Candidatus Oleimmundimicrobium sp.]|uniref:transcription termination factor NusA n=1 Tax=Candidatus Oleimmundimicrobium sp. TaxID=3060597 RepID=UPI002726DC9E|nr:transcription termination factor NusA [Candidatus Oleimmundimicrobium sp.]MDO8885451.1 transcription termination factor NusA [Candidatus Oleimmundimicrobium sp.]
MKLDLMDAIRQIEREKKIDPEIILEALKTAIASAYKKNYGANLNVYVEIDPESGKIKVFSRTEVEKKGKKEIIEKEITPKDFGRIAAQTAKQVILQKIREAEREMMYGEYIDREGDIVTGIIQQSDQRYTLVNLGRVEALMPSEEQVPGERYEHGMRIKAYIVEVRRTSKEPQIIISRTHPGLLKRLFELEVPEISDGYVEIKSVAREPGFRSKIAVSSRDESIDPVGACVGPKGSRVRMVVGELRGEKIDVVKWNEDSATYVASALSPAKVKTVIISKDKKTAQVIVPNDQLSLAIGKEGQNARLAAKLTGWRIDIISENQVSEKLEVEGKESEKATLKKSLAEEGLCQATTKSGKPCKNKAKPGSNYCGIHKGIDD